MYKKWTSMGPKFRYGVFLGALGALPSIPWGCAHEQSSFPSAPLAEIKPAASLDEAPMKPPAHRFVNGQPSARHLADLVLLGIKEKDAALVHSLRVTEKEYKTYIFPEIAAPGNPVDLNWKLTEWHSLAGVGKAIEAFGGEELDLVDVIATEGVEEYPSFKVLNKVVLQVKKDNEPLRQLRLFGSVILMDGEYKILSFRN